MSWASNRKATRPEDLPYSLMGLFDIHMPFIYGEGMKAFTRLQEEIVQRVLEPTFLFWGLGDSTSRLLASTPAGFRGLNELREGQFFFITPSTMNNVGLKINATLIRYHLGAYGLVLCHSGQTVYAVLIRKHPFHDAFCKIGFGKVAFQLPCWSRKRKSTIFRDSFDNYRDLRFAFHVQTEK